MEEIIGKSWAEALNKEELEILKKAIAIFTQK